MGDPRRLRTGECEILITRELRKAGLHVSKLKARPPARVPEGNDDEWTMEIAGVLQMEGAARRILVECRSERQPTRADAVRHLVATLAENEAQHGMLFVTSGYEVAAAREARAHGVPLLVVADGKAAFARSQGGMAGQPPSWVPEYMSEVVDLAVTGELRHYLVVSDQPNLIFDRFQPAAEGS